MSEEIARQFIDALWTLEGAHDVAPLVALIGEACVTGNVVSPKTYAGPEGAREFWTHYRETFGEIRSEFRNVIATEDRAALEWTTTGTGFSGAPVNYDGVSILEVGGGKITRFHAYFDPKHLGRQMEQG